MASVKQQVRDRDGMRCVQCGLTNDEHKAKHRGRGLEVHRLIPGSPYTLDGCVTLCRPCHVACRGFGPTAMLCLCMPQETLTLLEAIRDCMLAHEPAPLSVKGVIHAALAALSRELIAKRGRWLAHTAGPKLTKEGRLAKLRELAKEGRAWWSYWHVQASEEAGEERV